MVLDKNGNVREMRTPSQAPAQTPAGGDHLVQGRSPAWVNDEHDNVTHIDLTRHRESAGRLRVRHIEGGTILCAACVLHFRQGRDERVGAVGGERTSTE